ncbi:alpha/beta hydrolase family protein [Dethiobacter alkaliphilus]|uniref:Uncharacterized protein n=1 Tax=Dethiobacter alkaliphilus AHT 1 TaxID=555088 RepID=C0GCF5_DETAL|nr:alpha/beta hydrolase [Dethiobacter alkaliphilus]EEG78890.1 hypothetical protein DealDRAFT_0164 [Dethiobacter alkaliphilus AHT 1]
MKTFLTWLKKRAVQTTEYDSHFWLVTAKGLWIAAGLAVIIAGLGNPTGLGLIPDLIIYFTLHIIGFFLLTRVTAFLLSLMHLPVPRLFVSSLLCTGFLTYYILYLDKLGILFSAIIGVTYAVAGFLLGLFIFFLTSRKISLKQKTAFVMLPVAFYLIFLFWPPGGDTAHPGFSPDAGQIVPLSGNSPATPGGYPYHYFTYGSGGDKHRPEFNSGAELLSTSVDASHYIDEWPWVRNFFWGFDETSIPLNGRVWMPEGEGPFPLVLIVHGNHRMEHFSDDGYGYLGKLLASRGFIAISVDQNFLNYSGWSGIPKEDMKLRAWILMQHLLQIEDFQRMPDTPFYRQVDLQNIALIGHSRGGQAAAMVADYTTWFTDDPTVSGMEDLGIQAVVGIAPTDRRINGRAANLNDTFYLVLHGAQDGDVNSFVGDRQYARTDFEQGSRRFKASVYIGEANHSQFNSDWGRMDSSPPRGLFLNLRDIMEPQEQQKVTQVYIAAFLETALRGNQQFIPLFKDYRFGANWLPDAKYISRFADGQIVPMTEFERNSDQTAFEYDVEVEAEGFSLWEIQEALDRRRRNKGFYGVTLAWEDEGRYSTILTDAYRAQLSGQPQSVIVSMANLEREIAKDYTFPLFAPVIEVELQTTDNIAVRLPLDQFMPFAEQIYIQYGKMSWFDSLMRSGKYEEAAEPVFQTYELPLQVFKEQNPDLQAEKIASVTLHFSSGPGKVMIDSLGFSLK